MPYGTLVVVSAGYEGFEIVAGLGSLRSVLQYRIVSRSGGMNLGCMVGIELKGDIAL